MKVATVIVAAIILFLVIQWQISGINVNDRKEDCKVVTESDGSLRKANDYEYYTCIAR